LKQIIIADEFGSRNAEPRRTLFVLGFRSLFQMGDASDPRFQGIPGGFQERAGKLNWMVSRLTSPDQRQKNLTQRDPDSLQNRI